MAGWAPILLAVVPAFSLLAEQGSSSRPSRFEGKDCLTAGCHAALATPKYLHGPMAVGECQRCHRETNPVRHTFQSVAEAPALCLSCHEALAAQLHDRTHRPRHHPPVDEGKCLSCHNPHASNQPMMLRKDSVVDLCMSCHADKISLAGEVHKPILEKGCLECHRGHASDYDKLLRVAKEDLCLRCHQDEYNAFATCGSVHPPFREKNCVGCHTPHASLQIRLLAKRYDTDLYGPFDEQRYELCFSCHKPELAQHARTTADTNFRNGEQNLHYLHVNKESKGRSCRICHVPHGSDQDRLIRSSVPYRDWTLRIRFVATDTGGYCGLACHPAKRYDRVSPVDWNQEPVVPTGYEPGG